MSTLRHVSTACTIPYALNRRKPPHIRQAPWLDREALRARAIIQAPDAHALRPRAWTERMSVRVSGGCKLSARQAERSSCDDGDQIEDHVGGRGCAAADQNVELTVGQAGVE